MVAGCGVAFDEDWAQGQANPLEWALSEIETYKGQPSMGTCLGPRLAWEWALQKLRLGLWPALELELALALELRDALSAGVLPHLASGQV